MTKARIILKTILAVSPLMISVVALVLTLSSRQRVSIISRDVAGNLRSVEDDINSVIEDIDPMKDDVDSMKDEICSDRERLDEIEDVLNNSDRFHYHIHHISCFGSISAD